MLSVGASPVVLFVPLRCRFVAFRYSLFLSRAREGQHVFLEAKQYDLGDIL